MILCNRFCYYAVIRSGREMRQMGSTQPDDAAYATFPCHVNNMFVGLTQGDTLL